MVGLIFSADKILVEIESAGHRWSSEAKANQGLKVK